MKAVEDGKVHGVWHQFYQFIVIQQMAKWMHPELFGASLTRHSTARTLAATKHRSTIADRSSFVRLMNCELKMLLRRLILAATLSGFAATPAPAQPMDPNDLAFWQSIQTAQNPAEYEAYLRQFPNGLFAELARLRLAQLGTGAGAPTPSAAGITTRPPSGAPAMSAPVASTQVAGAVVGDATLALQPSQPRVGQPITLTTQGMPETDERGMFVVVPAGTPDESLAQQPVTADTVASSYTTIARNYTTAQAKWTFGPLPPGAYEARWMTTLYNLKGTYEVGARTAFQVGR